MKKILKIVKKSTAMFMLLAFAVSSFGFSPSQLAQAVDVNVTTNPATTISQTDATLNGTNGGTNSIGSSFWTSLNTFSTASPTLPVGVYSTPDFGAVLANTSFSSSLSSSGITVTPNTTYYFAAWSNVGGTWYPGEVLSFTTSEVVLPGTLSAEDFGVVDYDAGGGLGIIKGYTAGFGLADNTFTGATSVVVKLYAAGNVLLQTNTAIFPKFNLDITGTQFSSPFDVSGTFNYGTDGYWTNARESQYGQSVPATKVVATVTLQNGKVVTAENTLPTGDPTTIYPAPTTATIVTQKIVCDNESDLPNWGNGGSSLQQVTSNTASRYVATHPTCRLVPWTFESAPNGTNNPGDNVGVAGGSWTSFTNSTTVPAGSKVWIREQANSNYIPFSGDITSGDGWNAVSAEMYCHTDVLNYDNYDWINPIVAGQTYYCVAFNVLKENLPPNECDATATQTIVSDTDTQYNSGDSTVLVPNAGWTTIPGASWIWGTNGSTDDTTVPTTQTFTKSFSIIGTPTSASIKLSADNGYVLKVNGTTVDSRNVDPTNEFNYQSVETYDITSYVNSGVNTLEVQVTNFSVSGTTFNENPAGLIYSLTVNNNECENEELNGSVVTNPATTISQTDATLNGTNGANNATESSFWASLNTFSTASPTLPVGVYSTPDLGPVAANTSFSALLSSTGITVTPNTTYYFAAWSKVGGTWYPGAVLSFTTTPTEGGIGGEVVPGKGILQVTSIEMTDSTGTANNTYENGWEYVFNITVPTDETDLSMKFANWIRTGGIETIAAGGNMRISSPQANNGGATIPIVTANTYSIPALTMITDLNPLLDGIQVKVTVEVKIPTGTTNGSYTTTYGVKSE